MIRKSKNRDFQRATYLKGFKHGVFSVYGLNRSKLPRMLSDEESMRSDWSAVGHDLRHAIAQQK